MDKSGCFPSRMILGASSNGTYIHFHSKEKHLRVVPQLVIIQLIAQTPRDTSAFSSGVVIKGEDIDIIYSTILRGENGTIAPNSKQRTHRDQSWRERGAKGYGVIDGWRWVGR